MKASLEIAIEDLKKSDIREVCKRSGAVHLGKNIISLIFLYNEYLIALPDIKITDKNGEDVPVTEQQILVHYLTTSTGTQSFGKTIDFRQMPGGNIYYQVFESRIHKPFLKIFGAKPDAFPDTAVLLGGKKTKRFGEFSIAFTILPHVTIDLILYPGDDEFSPDCKILFDSNICDHLSTEGAAVACEELVKKLIERSAKLTNP